MCCYNYLCDVKVQRCNSVPVNLFYFNGSGGDASGYDTSDLLNNPDTNCSGSGFGVGDVCGEEATTTTATATSINTANTGTFENDLSGLIDSHAPSGVLDSSALLITCNSNSNTMNSSHTSPLESNGDVSSSQEASMMHYHSSPGLASTNNNADLLPIFLPSLVINTPSSASSSPQSSADPAVHSNSLIAAVSSSLSPTMPERTSNLSNISTATKLPVSVNKRPPVKSASLDFSDHQHRQSLQITDFNDHGIDLVHFKFHLK